MTDWKPGASTEALRQRSELLSAIRNFFKQREVLEVETPLLCHGTTTDVFIQSFEVANASGKRFLQTSPEYAMKRLLAAGSGPIFQVCKSFRQSESSRLHNPEFTMLEWYRPDFTMFDLMEEVELLMSVVTKERDIPRFSYRELFLNHLQFDPHVISSADLQAVAEKQMDLCGKDFSDTDYLQLLMDKCIEPRMPSSCFVYDYPVAQAALAKIESDEQNQQVARRFELYAGGMELANGYFELTDADQQRARIEKDLLERKRLGLANYPMDEKLLAALGSGLPACSGVALGVDRLLMLITGNSSIEEVLAFTTDRA